MEFNFYKIRLIDSDYLLINALVRPLPGEELLERLSADLCHRTRGIGAGGVIYLAAGEEHTARLHFFDRRGVRTLAPPDAILAAARYSFDFGLAERERLRFELEEGLGEVRCIDSSHFQLTLPPPRDPRGKTVRREGRSDYTVTLSTDTSSITCTPLCLDIPAAAIYAEREAFLDEEEMPGGAPEAPVEIAGTAYHRVYYAVPEKEELRMALPGRFPGHLSSYAAACGTAALLNGFCKDQIVIQYGGEQLFYRWSTASGELLITAAPAYVCTGTYYQEDDEASPEVSDDPHDAPHDDRDEEE
jgi:diaminopimelate epimerase